MSSIGLRFAILLFRISTHISNLPCGALLLGQCSVRRSKGFWSMAFHSFEKYRFSISMEVEPIKSSPMPLFVYKNRVICITNE